MYLKFVNKFEDEVELMKLIYSNLNQMFGFYGSSCLVSLLVFKNDFFVVKTNNHMLKAALILDFKLLKESECLLSFQ